MNSSFSPGVSGCSRCGFPAAPGHIKPAQAPSKGVHASSTSVARLMADSGGEIWEGGRSERGVDAPCKLLETHGSDSVVIGIDNNSHDACQTKVCGGVSSQQLARRPAGDEGSQSPVDGCPYGKHEGGFGLPGDASPTDAEDSFHRHDSREQLVAHVLDISSQSL